VFLNLARNKLGFAEVAEVPSISPGIDEIDTLHLLPIAEVAKRCRNPPSFAKAAEIFRGFVGFAD
jgi:hypothetical protein